MELVLNRLELLHLVPVQTALVLLQTALVPVQASLAPPRALSSSARIVPCIAMTRAGQGWGHTYQSCRDLGHGADRRDPLPSTQSGRHSRNSTSPFQPPPRGLLRSLRHRPPSERTQGRCSNRSQWRFLQLAHPARLELQERASFGRRGNS